MNQSKIASDELSSFAPSPAPSRALDSLDHKSRCDRNPAGRLIAFLRAIR